MKKLIAVVLISALMMAPISIHAQDEKQGYITIIEGEDWGPSVTKLLVPTTIISNDVQVTAKKKATSATGEAVDLEGEVTIQESYRSDARGNHDEQGNFTALRLQIHPDDQLTNPFYFDMEAFANSWADLTFHIRDGEQTWDSEVKREKLVVDEFEKGTHSYNDEEFGNIELTYGAYAPEMDDEKNPLIIWLHGMGEGGTDPEIALLGNEVSNLANEEIQSYFNGAYVFAPQTPTFWLDNGTGSMSEDGSSMYTKALMDTIDAYVQANGDIDVDKIYIGGCSQWRVYDHAYVN